MRRHLWVIAFLVLILTGCTPPGTFRKVRSVIRDAVTHELGPADRYEVDTSRDSLQRLADGRMKKITVRGINVRPMEGVVLDEVLIDARDVEFDRSEKSIKSVGETVISAWISEDSLAGIAESQDLLRDPQARILTGNEVELTGYYEPFGLAVPVTARGRLSVAPPSMVEFVSTQVKAAGLPVPLTIRKKLDLATIYRPLIVQEIQTVNGQLEVHGTLDWTLR